MREGKGLSIKRLAQRAHGHAQSCGQAGGQVRLLDGHTHAVGQVRLLVGGGFPLRVGLFPSLMRAAKPIFHKGGRRATRRWWTPTRRWWTPGPIPERDLRTGFSPSCPSCWLPSSRRRAPKLINLCLLQGVSTSARVIGIALAFPHAPAPASRAAPDADRQGFLSAFHSGKGARRERERAIATRENQHGRSTRRRAGAVGVGVGQGQLELGRRRDRSLALERLSCERAHRA